MLRTVRRREIGISLATAVGLLLSAPGAQARDIDKIAREVREIRDNAQRLDELYLKTGNFKGDQYVAERLVDGENFYRIKDYQRSAIIFIDIVENYPTHAAYPDALFLYADSLFLSGDYLTARDAFKHFLKESSRPGGAHYKEKAVERLIEIAIHTDTYDGVESYFEMLGKFPSEAARYVKGKFLYFKGESGRAREVLLTITKDKLLRLKAQYLIGVILTMDEKYKDAALLFEQAKSAEAATTDEQAVVDLMNLGAGRLYFEQGKLTEASECYQRVSQSSPYFDAALYEAASVLIQEGDTVRAEQTLEVLTVAVPDSRYLPRAKMLRGNLLLRAGRYDDAETVFDEVVSDFTPVMDQLDSLIDQQQDTRQFFYELVEKNVSALDMSGVLPPLVVKWVAEEPEVGRALDLAKELGAAKGYIRETERLIRLLEAVVDGPARINAIPILRQGKRRAQQMANRLAQLQVTLAEMVESELKSSSPEIAALRAERLSLAEKIKTMPTSQEEFAVRDAQSQEIFLRMRAELQRNLIRLDRLNAMTVAIERFIEDARYADGVPKESLVAAREELKRHRYGIVTMQKELDDIRADVEKAGFQVGVGDSRDNSDQEMRGRMRALAQKERALVRAAGGKFGAQMETVYREIDAAEAIIASFEADAEKEAARRVQAIRVQVRSERDHVAAYSRELEGLGEDAEEVVGGVAFENFTSVRKRFHELVLKADVGIIDVAWLRKEEHTARIGEFTDARLKEIKSLDDEFQEVKDIKIDK